MVVEYLRTKLLKHLLSMPSKVDLTDNARDCDIACIQYSTLITRIHQISKGHDRLISVAKSEVDEWYVCTYLITLIYSCDLRREKRYLGHDIAIPLS